MTVKVGASQCRAFATLRGLTAEPRGTVTVQRKQGNWKSVGTTKSNSSAKWKLTRIGITQAKTKFRVTDGQTTNVPVIVTLKGLQTRGC